MEKFVFEGFTASEALELRANRTLDRMLERSPSDATVFALLSREDDHYRCAVEIHSSNGPFAVSTTHKLAVMALAKAERLFERKLEKWRRRRFDEGLSLAANLRFAE